MSVIARKKLQQKKGPELIFFGMTLTCVAVGAVYLILGLIISQEITSATMVPGIYFIVLAGICLAIGTYIREHEPAAANFKDWVISLCFLGVLIGAILGAYNWW